MIVLDTNVLSEIMRPEPSRAVIQWLAARTGGRRQTTSICQAEILAGIAVLPQGRRRDAFTLSALQLFERSFAGRILPFDSRAAPYFAEVRAARQRLGRPIKAADAMIAAIARAHGAAVATRNTDDFTDLGLTLHNPWAEEGG